MFAADIAMSPMIETDSHAGMTTIQTHDRALVLRCKRARLIGVKITVNYETHGGWNRVTGMVQSVRSLKALRFKPLWEIIIVADTSRHDCQSEKT